MLRAARRASLLLGFSLLTSAATAYAECAWVLWAGGVKTSGEAIYAPIEGYPTKAACEKGHSAVLSRRGGATQARRCRSRNETCLHLPT
jgi:hypothetical protein